MKEIKGQWVKSKIRVSKTKRNIKNKRTRKLEKTIPLIAKLKEPKELKA